MSTNLKKDWNGQSTSLSGLAKLSSHRMHFIQTQLSHQVNHYLMPQNQLMNKKRKGEEESGHLKEDKRKDPASQH